MLDQASSSAAPSTRSNQSPAEKTGSLLWARTLGAVTDESEKILSLFFTLFGRPWVFPLCCDML
jgi:hypothetical protein